MNIWFAAIGSGVVAFILAFVIAYILPKEKVKAANQLLEKQETEQQLKIKDLEKEYIEKQSNLERDYINKEKELEKNYQQQIQLCNEQTNELEEKNSSLKQEQVQLIQEIKEDKNIWEKEKAADVLNYTKQVNELQIEVHRLEERRDNIIQTLENEAKESGQIFKDQQIQIAKEQIEKARTELYNEYTKAQEDAKQTYLETLADMVAEITQNYGVKTKELEEVLVKLSEAQAKANAAVEVNKRAELDRQKKDFYRLQLSEEDLDEIKRLREVEPFLRDKEPLNKVIYKCYYEKPYTDLIGRIFGLKKPMGIYKITNLNNGKCYVGQATNIPERWRQHIKRGVGAEPVTQNKLYPAMKQEGVENFMFEVIEECKSADLTPREKYWTDFYQAQSYGYTVKKG